VTTLRASNPISEKADETMRQLFLSGALAIIAICAFSTLSFAQSPCPDLNMSEEWKACHNEWVYTCVSGSQQNRTTCENQLRRKYAQPQQARGVSPVTAWDCPASHPIKGNFTTYSGERCICHVPGGQYYSQTKPERCYSSIQDAIIDGCRQSLR